MWKITFQFVFYWWKNKCMGAITPVFTVRFLCSTFRVETIPSASGLPLCISKDGLSWCCNNKQLPCLSGLTHKNFFCGPGDSVGSPSSQCWLLQSFGPTDWKQGLHVHCDGKGRVWSSHKGFPLPHSRSGCISSTTHISFIRDLAKKLGSTVTCI